MRRKPMNLAQKTLIVFGTVAVITGGAISAFLPDKAASFDTWLVAYLILVVGVAQISIGWGLSKLPPKKVSGNIWTVFLSYNFGSWLVVSGTLIRETLLVYAGGGLIALAMVMSLYAVRGAKRTSGLYAYIFIVAIILVSVPVGLILSTVRH